MTSLADQLKAAASGDAARLLNANRSQPSYLYTSKQAAALTLDDCHNLGSNGFSALVQQNSSLAPFADSLLSDKARQTDRSLLAKDEVEKLDATLNQTLRLLGPFILIRPCGQALEWLIRRFRIHEYNIQALLSLMLPYHETPQFAQMLQIIDLEKDPAAVALKAVKKTMQPMTRVTLISLMSRHHEFMRLVVNTLSDATIHHTAHRAVVSFWTATLHAYLTSKQTGIVQSEMAVFMPAIFAAIKAKKNVEVQLAGYVVLTSLTAKATLTSEALESVLILIAQRMGQSASPKTTDQQEIDALANEEAALMTIITICQQQEEQDELPSKVWKTLASRTATIPTLLRLSQSHEIGHLLGPFARSLAHAAVAQDNKAAQSLLDLVKGQQPATAPASVNEVVARACLYQLQNQAEIKQEMADMAPQLIEPLWLIKQYQPEVFSKVFATAEHSTATDISFAITRFNTSSESGADVLSGVRDPDANVRKQFFSTLLANPRIYPAKESFDMLLAIFSDDAKEIVELLDSCDLGKFEKLPELADIITRCESVVFNDNADRQVVSSVAKFLTKSVSKAYPLSQDDVLRLLWPRLLSSRPSKRITSLIWEQLGRIGGTPLSPLLAGCEKLNVDSTIFNQKLVERIASNLTLAEDSRSLLIVITKVAASESSPTSGRILSALILAEAIKTATSLNSAAIAEAVHSFLRSHSPMLRTAKDVPMVDGEIASDKIYDAIYAQPQSPKTYENALVVLLLAFARYCPSESLSIDAGLFGKRESSAGLLFALMHNVIGNPAVAKSIAKELFGRMLKRDSLAFLMLTYLNACRDPTGSDDSALAALTDAAVIVEQQSQTEADYQIHVPALYKGLMHQNRAVRQATLNLLNSMTKSMPLKSDKLATPIRGLVDDATVVDTMTREQTLTYISVLLAEEQAILADSSHLLAVHADLVNVIRRQNIGYKKPKKLLANLLAVIATLVSLEPARATLGAALLKACSNVVDSEYFLGLVTTIKPFLDTPASVLKGMHEAEKREFISLMLGMIRTAKSDDILPDLVAALLDAVTRASTDGDANLVRTEALEIIPHIMPNLNPSQTVKALRSLTFLACNSTEYNQVGEKSKGVLRTLRLAEPMIVAVLADFRLEMAKISSSQAAGASKKRRLSNAINDTSKPATNSQNILAELQLALDLLPWTDFAPTVILVNAVLEIAASALSDSAVSRHPSFLSLLESVFNTATTILRNFPADLSTPELSISPALDVLRSNLLPRVTASALQVVTLAALHCPEQIARHIIPLFTFMGNNIMQKEDGQSQRLLQEIINAVLPAVVHHYRRSTSSQSDFVASMNDLIKTFTDAARHVPRHRQMALFVDFTFAIGSQDFLATVVVSLLHNAGTRGKNASGRLMDADSLIGLIQQFPIRDQLHALCQVANGLANLVKGNQEHTIASHAVLLDLWFRSKQVVSLVDSAQASQDTTFDQSFQDVIKAALQAQSVAKTSAAGTKSRDSAILHLDKLLTRVSQMISTNALADALSWVYNTRNERAIETAIVLLRARLARLKTDQRPPLSSVVTRTLSRLSQSIPARLLDKQYISEALQTLTVIAKGACSEEQPAVSAAFDSLLVVCSTTIAKYPNVAAQLTTCLAGMQKSMSTRLIGKMSAVLNLASQWQNLNVKGGLSAQKDSAVINLVDGLVSTVPEYIGSNSVDVIALVLHLEDSKNQQQAYKIVADRLPSATALTGVTEAWSSKGLKTGNTLSLLRMVIDAATSKEVTQHQRQIVTLIMDAYTTLPESTWSTNHDAFLAMTLKLSGASFRPIFLRLLDWAFVELPSSQKDNARPQVAFELTAVLLGRLEDVILPYFAHVIDHIITQLDLLSNSQDLSQKQWRAVMQCLARAFSLQDQDFWLASRLEPLVEPLLKQVQVVAAREKEFTTLSAIITAFAQLCASHERIIKQVNAQLLRRASTIGGTASTAISINAIQLLDSVWKTVGDELAEFVPESIPTLLELLESDSADIAQAAQALIKTIEGATGEPLDAVLT